jgi:phospholipid/cholesterol/gamma-HCH transport system permease protein
VEKGNASALSLPRARQLLRLPVPQSLTGYVGRGLFHLLLTLQGLGAFTLITLGVMITRFGAARRVIRPLIRQEVARAGLRLLPMFLFMSAALGLVVIGQTVSWLTQVGAINYLGTVMVVVVVRELGPLTAALLVLARIGTANVIELGTARAMGEGSPGHRPGALSGRAAGDGHGAGSVCADGVFNSRLAAQRLSLGLFAGRAAAAG